MVGVKEKDDDAVLLLPRKLLMGAAKPKPKAKEEEDLRERNIIPGLPNDLACLCLACIPLWQHRRVKLVCKAWYEAFSGPFLFDIRRKWGKTEEFLCLFRDDPSLTPGELFDSRAQVWSLLPPMPCDPYTYGLTNFECVAMHTGLFVIGGSLFDARSFPMDRPLPSSAFFRFDPLNYRWERLADMRHPRGSFGCAVWKDSIVVAGGGSRHAQFAAGGSRISSAERYDAVEDCWYEMENMRKIRAGCVGFILEEELWIMGGYGDSRTIAGILPVDEYYRDGEVLNLKTGTWRELKPMWVEGERRRLGRIAVVGGKDGVPGLVFMLDRSAIFRYDVAANRWIQEARVPVIVVAEGACRLIALDGELYVIPGGPLVSYSEAVPSSRKRRGALMMQIYHPLRRTWRSLLTRPPLSHGRRFQSSSTPWGATCVFRL